MKQWKLFFVRGEGGPASIQWARQAAAEALSRGNSGTATMLQHLQIISNCKHELTKHIFKVKTKIGCKSPTLRMLQTFLHNTFLQIGNAGSELFNGLEQCPRNIFTTFQNTTTCCVNVIGWVGCLNFHTYQNVSVMNIVVHDVFIVFFICLSAYYKWSRWVNKKIRCTTLSMLRMRYLHTWPRTVNQR